MGVHISAKKSEIAETVLMPGDPYRARWAAENFLTNPKLVNDTRGMLGFTGSYNGHPVTIQGSGMGMPSFSIYANELISEYGAKTLIRIGSCGGMQSNVKIRDVVIAMSCSTISTPSSAGMRELSIAPTADFELLARAVAGAKIRGAAVHVGSIYSSDTFYDERPDLNEILTRYGVLAVEMEAAELYLLAARHNIRALAIMTVSDHLVTGETLPPQEREQSFGTMVEIALDTAFLPDPSAN